MVTDPQPVTPAVPGEAVVPAAGTGPDDTSRVPPMAPEKPQEPSGPVPADPREPLGRVIHETRLAFNAEQDKPFGILAWEDRNPAQRELDMRIGSAVAARAVEDAGARNERLEMQLFAIGTALPAVRRALVKAITDAEYEAEAKPFRRALQIFGGEDGPADPATLLSVAAEAQERTDEKEGTVP